MIAPLAPALPPLLGGGGALRCLGITELNRRKIQTPAYGTPHLKNCLPVAAVLKEGGIGGSRLIFMKNKIQLIYSLIHLIFYQ